MIRRMMLDCVEFFSRVVENSWFHGDMNSFILQKEVFTNFQLFLYCVFCFECAFFMSEKCNHGNIFFLSHITHVQSIFFFPFAILGP